MTEFVENTDGKETEKQDCERKAFYRLKKKFPHLPVCLSADSLYACENIFRKCQEHGWRYILRFKEGSIPTVVDEFEKLKKTEHNSQKHRLDDGTCEYDFVTGVDYNGYGMNIVEYNKKRNVKMKKGPGKGSVRETATRSVFLTDLPASKKNTAQLVEAGRRRWKIENEGFNAQKKHGYYLEHLFSKNYQAIKNHYYLIQIGHMISQIMEAWKKLWKKAGLDLAEKHNRIWESFRNIRLCEHSEEIGKKFQMRFQ